KKLSFPRIVSEPNTKIGAGLTHLYQVEFENSPAFPFAFSLVSAPTGMKISPNGEIRWETSLYHVGQHHVMIEAYEASNPDNKVEQSYLLTVTEYCDLAQPALALFLDRNQDGSPEGDKIITLADEFKGSLSALENYNYKWWAPHIQIGPAGDYYASSVFFYRGSDGLYLFLLIDREGGGAFANRVDIGVSVKGNGFVDDILFADDPARWWRKSPLERVVRERGHFYLGSFMNWFKADGAVIGPLHMSEDLQVAVQIEDPGQLRHLYFHRYDESPEGRRYSLVDESADGGWPGLIFALSQKAPCLE
ncbi:MAG: hypothetical protein KDD43_09665, partial [Bdellovibrionales bacterium]|nr:hypothetical protein [Bdellovibrionales bacterium]